MSWNDAAMASLVLVRIRSLLEGADLEQRLAKLEAQQADQDGADHAAWSNGGGRARY